MSSWVDNNYLIKSSVKYNYSINAKHADIFEYLSDTTMLLTNVPHVSKIHIYKGKGLARLFCSMPVLTFKLHTVVDIETRVNPQENQISFTRPVSALDKLPSGYIAGTFGANLKVTPKDNGDTGITSTITLGFDSGQFELLKLFPRGFLESAGQKMLQDFVEQTSQNYINKVAGEFPVWLKKRGSSS
jgi:hypothetical protein